MYEYYSSDSVIICRTVQEIYETICMLKWFAGSDGSQVVEIPQVFIYCALSREIQNIWYQNAGLQGPGPILNTEILLNFFRPGIKSDSDQIQYNNLKQVLAMSENT